MPTSFIIRELEYLLEEGNAHATFDKAVKGLPPALAGKVPATKAPNGPMNTGQNTLPHPMNMH